MIIRLYYLPQVVCRLSPCKFHLFWRNPSFTSSSRSIRCHQIVPWRPHGWILSVTVCPQPGDSSNRAFLTTVTWVWPSEHSSSLSSFFCGGVGFQEMNFCTTWHLQGTTSCAWISVPRMSPSTPPIRTSVWTRTLTITACIWAVTMAQLVSQAVGLWLSRAGQSEDECLLCWSQQENEAA